MPTVCLHCERLPPVSPLGLCAACHARAGIRRLYYHRDGWTEVDERLLLEMCQRAKRQQPLFGEGVRETMNPEGRQS
jgi:hypothetical protein